MLDANIIMYSRSLTKDYRWIYWSDLVDKINKKLIFNDYSEFESNKGFFLKEDYLIVRQFCEGIAVYKFLETRDKDQNSRKIYALLGCLFSEMDFDIVRSMFKYVISYISNEFDILFEKYQSNIPEKKEHLVESIQFSLDTITENAKNGKDSTHLINSISNFINQYPNKNLLIKNNSNLILWENKLPLESTRRIENNTNKITGLEPSSTVMVGEKPISEYRNRQAYDQIHKNLNTSLKSNQQKINSVDMERVNEIAGNGNALQRKGVEERNSYRLNSSTPQKEIEFIAGNPNIMYPETPYKISKESKGNIDTSRGGGNKSHDEENTKERFPKIIKRAVEKIIRNE